MDFGLTLKQQKHCLLKEGEHGKKQEFFRF